MTFHPVVVLGPEHDFLFKSTSTYCAYLTHPDRFEFFHNPRQDKPFPLKIKKEKIKKEDLKEAIDRAKIKAEPEPMRRSSRNKKSSSEKDNDDKVKIVPVPPKKMVETEVIDIADSDPEDEELTPKVAPNPFHVAAETRPSSGVEQLGNDSENDETSTSDESSGVDDAGEKVDPSFSSRCKDPDDPTPLKWQSKAEAKSYPETPSPSSPKPGSSNTADNLMGSQPGSPKPGCSTAAERFEKRNKFPNSNWRHIIRTAFPEDVA